VNPASAALTTIDITPSSSSCAPAGQRHISVDADRNKRMLTMSSQNAESNDSFQ